MSVLKSFETAKQSIIDVIKKYSSQNYNEECLLPVDFVERIEDYLEEQKINIGIIGQMKYGKSTFLNAFLFRKQLLPVNDTPMTAKLTFIEYGKTNEAEVEFLSRDDFKALKKYVQTVEEEKASTLKRELEEIESLIESREVVNYLGKKKKVPIDRIVDYVGAEGKFTHLTKLLKLKFNVSDIKGSVIVDTPGFNDPVQSREKITEEFLGEADVLIMFLYAGRTFDSTDLNILVEKLKYSSSAKLMLLINKMDMLGSQDEISKVTNYTIKTYKEEVEKRITSEEMKKLLLDAQIIPVSSLCALLGRMDMDSIRNDEDMNWYFNDLKSKFGFESQQDFLEFSNIGKVENLILSVIKEDALPIIVGNTKKKVLLYFKKHERDLIQQIRKLEKEKDYLIKGQEKIEEEKQMLEEKERELLEKIEKIRISTKDRIYEIFNEVEYGYDEKIDNLYKKYTEKIEGLDIGWGIITDDFNKDVRRILDEAFYDAKGFSRRKLREVSKEVKKELEKFVNLLFEELYSIQGLREIVKLNMEDENALKEAITDSFSDFGISNFEDFEDTKFSVKKGIIRVSDSDAKEQARGALKNTLEKVREVFQEIFEELNAAVDPIIDKRGDIISKFRKSLFQPVRESLKIAEENLKRKQQRVNEIDKQLEELNLRLNKYKKNRKALEVELEKIDI